MFGTGRGFAPSGFGQSEITPQFGGPSGEVPTPQFGVQQAGATNPAAPLPNAGKGAAAASSGDCCYFLQGTCTKGHNCLFRHSEAAKASGTVCRFWQNGFCKDDTNCSFQHPASGPRGQGVGGGRGGRFGSGRGMGGGRGFGGGRAPPRAQGWETVDRSKQACVFFAQGKCTKGDACPFSHAISAAGGVSQAPVSGHPPQRTGVPEGRLQPVVAAAADPPLSRMPAGQNGNLPHTEPSASEGTNVVRISSAGFSGQGGGLASASVAGRNGPGPYSNQDGAFGGGTFATGPAAVVVGAPKTYVTGRNGQARVTATSNQRQEAPGHTGIIALPDGGFVTRKRAAELQLGRDERSDEPRQVRQRDDREQGRAQEHRPALLSGNRGVPPGGRVSIMDRLGPAKQAPERAPTRERIMGPVRTRPEVPGQQARKREVPRQHTTPVERPVVQTSSPSLLPRSRGLGSTRPTRRTEGGRGDGVSTSPVARSAAVTQQQKSTALDFKIPTLGEIKSRKAKAEGAAPEAAKKREGRPEQMSKNGQGLCTSKDSKPDRATSGSFSRAAVTTEATSPRSSTAVAGAEVLSAEVHTSAPAPTVQINPPQLDAEDMDEFSEWL